MKLSICIPTFNRRDTLRELLDSIESQWRDGVEVVIADDASPDDTAEVITAYRARIPALVACTHALNIGLDANYQAVARLAHGEYLWMMGDDDRLEPGAIDRVLALLNRWPDLIGMTIGVIDYDATLSRVTGLRHMPDEQVVIGAGALFSLMAEHLGFMSALVIRRDRWLQVCERDPVDRFQNLYSQVYVIGRAVGDDGRWGVTPELCVGYRSDNDQFGRQLGWYRRLEADVVGYRSIADALFGAQLQVHRTMLCRIAEAHVVSRVRNGKLQGIDAREQASALRLVLTHYAGLQVTWLQLIPTLLAPSLALRLAKRIHQAVNGRSGRQRAQAAKAGAEMPRP